MTSAEAREALARLRPEDRALLELSLHREVADAALAELLHIPPDEVASRREAAMEQLVAESRGSPRDQLEGALIENWRGAAAAGASARGTVPAALATSHAPRHKGLVLSLSLSMLALAWRLGRGAR
jgi:hypothetical protein